MKRTKIIYGMGISLIIISIVGIIFYYMNFTRKLVCTRKSDPYVHKEEIQIMEFRFDVMGKIKSLNVISENTYNTKQLAKEEYEYFKKEFKEEIDLITITMDENVIVLNADTNIDEHKTKNRMKLKKEYEGYYYVCK